MGARVWIGIGVALTLAGTAGAVLTFFKPWASCPYDDVPAGCALLPWEAQLMAAAWLILFLGVGVIGMGAALLLRAREERAAGPRP